MEAKYRAGLTRGRRCFLDVGRPVAFYVIRIIPGTIKLCLFFAFAERAAAATVGGPSDLQGGAGDLAVSGAARYSQQFGPRRGSTLAVIMTFLETAESVMSGDFYSNSAGELFQYTMKVCWLWCRSVLHVRARSTWHVMFIKVNIVWLATLCSS